MEGLGTDEEAIFATLMAYERNTGLVARLKLRYSALYAEDLRARLVDELAADEFANAAYLMGEAALEQTELSPAQAARVFTVMSTLTFTDTTGAQSPVPYHYPVDGCYARAQMMAQMLTRAGIASERVFATSTVPGGLHIPNQYSEDQPGGAPPETTWWYHVAPIVRVKTATGAIEETVIDPSTQSGPVPIATWLAAMGVAPGTYSRKTHAELMAHLAAPPPGPVTPGGFPMGEQIVYTTDRNTMYPGEGPHAGLRVRRRRARGAEPDDDELRRSGGHARDRRRGAGGARAAGLHGRGRDRRGPQGHAGRPGGALDAVRDPALGGRRALPRRRRGDRRGGRPVMRGWRR